MISTLGHGEGRQHILVELNCIRWIQRGGGGVSNENVQNPKQDKQIGLSSTLAGT